jgi:hypothetical protein
MGKSAVTAVLLLLAVGSLVCACSNSTAPSTSSLAVTGTVPPVGQTSQLSAKATLANGTIQDVTATATWSSSNTAVATVTVTGLITLLQPGAATIKATYQGVSGQFSILLQVASVTIAGTTPLTIPQQVQFTATAKLLSGVTQDVTGQASWQSSNAVAVASVSPSGLVTAEGAGAAAISVTYLNTYYTIPVSVSCPGLPGLVSDPAGDAEFGAPDIVCAAASVVGTNLELTVMFKRGTFVAATGQITFALDTDRNPATGFAGVDRTHDDAGLIGVDRWVVFNPLNFGTGFTVSDGLTNQSLGGGAIQYFDGGILALVPLSLLGGDGSVNYVVLSQTAMTAYSSNPIGDFAPDIGDPVGTCAGAGNSAATSLTQGRQGRR